MREKDKELRRRRHRRMKRLKERRKALFQEFGMWPPPPMPKWKMKAIFKALLRKKRETESS